MLQLKKENISEAQTLAKEFRLIDDLCTFNDNGLFKKNFKSIYPVEMELKKENNGHHIPLFLDLEISIANNQFEPNVLTKEMNFPLKLLEFHTCPRNKVQSYVGWRNV